MTTLRCTKALLDEIGQRRSALIGDARTESRYGDWYATLLRIERSQCVIFVNGRTLLSFVVAGVSRGELRDLPELFARGLSSLLEREGWTRPELDALLREHGEMVIGRTRSRSVLASMNDLVFKYTFRVQYEGGLESCDLHEVARHVNRIPQRPIDWKFPIEAWFDLAARRTLAPPLGARRQRYINDLADRLRSGALAQVELRYVDVIPEVFESLPRFMQACALHDLVCTVPHGMHANAADIVLHVRRASLLTRIGLEVPEAN